jgi:MFS family permease
MSSAKSSGSSEFTRSAILAAAGAWFGFLTGPNVMVAATNSNFLRILPEVLHTNRTNISFALAVSLWLNAMLVPIGGRMVDRFGLRKVVLPGILIFAAVFLAMSQMQVGWHFLAFQILMAVPVSMHASPAYAKLVSLWFDRNRGKVLGLCVALGAGLGQTIMPKLTQWMIATYGWRGAYVGVGSIILAIGFPMVALLAHSPKSLSEKRKAADEQPAINPIGHIGVTRGEALRQPVFYLVFFAIAFGSMSLLATMQHAVPLLTERGLSINTATTVMSCAFAGVIFGQLSSGILADRFNSPRVVLPYFMCALVGVLVVHSQNDPRVLIPGALFMGLGLGGEISQNAYLVSRYFGLRAFGSIYGLTFAASAAGNGTGVILLGYIRDHFGSYAPGIWLVGMAMGLSVTCVAMMPRFVYESPNAK